MGKRIGRRVHMDHMNPRIEPPGNPAPDRASIAVVIAVMRRGPARAFRAVGQFARHRPVPTRFSRLAPDTPIAPGSRPPWPASISTIGPPGTLAAARERRLPRRQVPRSPALTRFAGPRTRWRGARAQFSHCAISSTTTAATIGRRGTDRQSKCALSLPPPNA